MRCGVEAEPPAGHGRGGEKGGFKRAFQAEIAGEIETLIGAGAVDAWDFESHAHIPDSGWPITRAALDPYLAEACEILEIPPAFADRPLAGSDGSLERLAFQKRRPPVRFGAKYRDALAANERVDLYLNANLCEIHLDENGGRIAEFRCASPASPTRRRGVRADRFVLALGGIENARLLLASRAQAPAGVGNGNDLVGRYFTEHIHVLAGTYATRSGRAPFDRKKDTFLAPTPAWRDRLRIANGALRIGTVPPKGSSGNRARTQGAPETRDIVREYLETFPCEGVPASDYVAGYVKATCEQAPNRNSRVLLDGATDVFGVPRTRLDWRLAPLDRRTIEKSVICLGRTMASLDCGHVKLIDWLRDPEAPIPAVGEDPWLGAAWHHMGTTRMGQTAETGVVDADCRVFGIENLYVAGSSVFATGGHANPTLSLLQLTLRLGDHLLNTSAG